MNFSDFNMSISIYEKEILEKILSIPSRSTSDMIQFYGDKEVPNHMKSLSSLKIDLELINGLLNKLNKG